MYIEFVLSDKSFFFILPSLPPSLFPPSLFPPSLPPSLFSPSQNDSVMPAITKPHVDSPQTLVPPSPLPTSPMSPSTPNFKMPTVRERDRQTGTKTVTQRGTERDKDRVRQIFLSLLFFSLILSLFKMSASQMCVVLMSIQ